MIKPSSTFQITSLLEENPMIKLQNNLVEEDFTEENSSQYLDRLPSLNDQIYQFKWEKLMGNDLIFDEYGELVCKTNEHLNWDSSVKFQPKSNDAKDINIDNIRADGLDDKTLFYKQLLKRLQELETKKSLES